MPVLIQGLAQKHAGAKTESKPAFRRRSLSCADVWMRSLNWLPRRLPFFIALSFEGRWRRATAGDERNQNRLDEAGVGK